MYVRPIDALVGNASGSACPSSAWDVKLGKIITISPRYIFSISTWGVEAAKRVIATTVFFSSE